MNEAMNRRNFLKTSTLAAGSALLATPVARAMGANDRIRVGIVGMGVRGTQHLKALAQLAERQLANVEVTAVCELWTPWREKAVAEAQKLTGRKPEAFVRHTELLERGDVDAVIITTPDFWHVPILLDCIKAGKDVYVEKPLCVHFEEAKLARAAVKASDRIVQVGTQRRSETKFHAAREFVKSGRLGKIITADGAYNDRSPRWRREAECKAMKESDFDWKFYLRDLPYRPFNPRHVLEWKLFREFTMGVSGLLGCHMYDIMQFVLDAPFPSSAVSLGGVYVYKDGREVEDTFETLIEFPEEFILHYTTRLGNAVQPNLTLYGTNGMLDLDRAVYSGKGGLPGDALLPAEEQKLKVEKARPHAHMLDFLECMRSRKEPIAGIDVGYQHAVTSLLAQEAMRSGRKLRYDRQKDEIV
ncbi:MAG TPA: Gfo/Idh/MocA family oxidoreductase [Phycisphaerae bacterium]|jgi:predicted dehydrogenase|nr:Gfo/Idh/MocA family oxidoreductase [Phycisphaerae bacterium]HOB73394.1 Gfo/Idh/MocA family oxidoreductase [Phycisphaerae bacterium]HOJ54954.1 Gfo/Idh/MocA family oxidoreductase [Phycisphaerae bacterium]HOL25036.1 Gfo/Idh/MocA family oxidoreductase [Phycisphaerae bacterium]HPP21337.1 Gfo/Idh/MocA family oxidoreductase [Phycisphaerae bacterium]